MYILKLYRFSQWHDVFVSRSVFLFWLTASKKKFRKYCHFLPPPAYLLLLFILVEYPLLYQVFMKGWRTRGSSSLSLFRNAKKERNKIKIKKLLWNILTTRNTFLFSFCQRQNNSICKILSQKKFQISRMISPHLNELLEYNFYFHLCSFSNYITKNKYIPTIFFFLSV